MNKINLTYEEVLGISTYIEEVSSNPVVESIFIVSYKDDETKKNTIELVTIWNHSLAYCERGYGGLAWQKAAEDRDSLDASVEHYNELFKDKRLKFISQDSGLYDFTLMHNRELLAATTLISGEILFDRFGDIEDLKKRISKKILPYNNLLNIENIDSIKSVSGNREYVKK